MVSRTRTHTQGVDEAGLGRQSNPLDSSSTRWQQSRLGKIPERYSSSSSSSFCCWGKTTTTISKRKERPKAEIFNVTVAFFYHLVASNSIQFSNASTAQFSSVESRLCDCCHHPWERRASPAGITAESTLSFLLSLF